MPIVAHSDLPSYDRLRQDGYTVLTPERAENQDIRPLHVGFLNMMPDAALAATERQFFRLVGSSNPISQFYIHPFTLDEIPRSDAAREHINRYYETLDQIKAGGLDALIITGANVTEADISKEIFWEPLKAVVDWAYENVTSTLYSCLASHAVFLARYGIERKGLPLKRWGVFKHEVTDRSHPLVRDVNTLMDVPQSRFNEVTRKQLEEAGLHVLIESEESGVQLVVSADGFRNVYFQGHPEYDSISLMKEYKREVGRFFNGETTVYPPFPNNYFDTFSQALLDEFEIQVRHAKSEGAEPPIFPEPQLLPRLHNSWHDSGEAVVGNWVGLVYQLTHTDRSKPFMEDINPTNPLRWSGVGPT